MLRVTLRQMQMFRTFMQSRSVTETASQIGVTQPAVSKTLAQIEGALEIQLFERARGRILPLDSAHRLYIEADRLLRQVDAVNDAVEELRVASETRLTVAAIPILASTVIASSVGRYLGTHANAQVNSIAMSSDNIVAYIKERRVQLGFVHRVVEESGIDGEVVAKSEIVCVARKDHPLARKRAISPQDLAGLPLILLDALTPSTEVLRRLFQEHGVSPTIAV